jgi:hypothetical protein
MEAELAAELEREAHARDAARRGREEVGEGEEPDQAADGAPPALVSARADVLGGSAEAAAPASQRWGLTTPRPPGSFSPQRLA